MAFHTVWSSFSTILRPTCFQGFCVANAFRKDCLRELKKIKADELLSFLWTSIAKHSPFGRNFQAFSPPQSFHPLVIHLPAFPSQQSLLFEGTRNDHIL